MKTLTITCAIAGLVLAGCASVPTSSVTVTAPARTVTAEAPAPGMSNGQMIRSLLESQGYTYVESDQDLEALAESVCEALDSGVSPSTLIEVATGNGFSLDEGVSLVAASIVVVCPWNESTV